LPEIKERDHKRTRDKTALVERLSEKAMKRKPKLEARPGASTIIHAAGHH